MFRDVYAHLCVAATVLCIIVPQAESQSSGTSVPIRLTLADAENLLLQRNLTVLAAKYQIEANRASRLIATYKPNPVLTVGGEQIPFYSPIAGSVPRFFKTNPDAGANPVYTLRIDKIWERGGKRELRTSIADEQLKASEAQMMDAVRTQLFQLRRAFGVAILARENLKLAEGTEQQYRQTEALTLAKVQQGDIAGVELYRAGAGRLQYQQAILQQRTAYDVAIRDVLNLLGAREQDVQTSIAEVTSLAPTVGNTPQLPDSLRSLPLEIVADFEDQPVSQSLTDLRSIALAERPDVIAARHLVASAESNMQLALAQRTRDIDTAYEYQRVGSDHSAGVVLQIPLFAYNNQRALYTQADAQKRSAEAQLKQTELQAITEVDKAYQSYISARRILDLYSAENLGQLERLRSVANVSYKEGASSLFELLDAQRAYSLAMTAYNQARSDYQTTLWELEQATGRSLAND
jgi:cobalt-zinc-cadmium efflux system outer membrane protein